MNEIEQKEIEEMAKVVLDYKFSVKSEDFSYKDMCKAIYNAGYRNVKDKVVLDKEEYEKFLKVNSELAVCQKSVSFLTSELNDYKQRYASAEKRYEQLKQSSYEALKKKGKEQAREIFAELVGHTFNDDGWTWTISQKDIQWLADKYGVEVE